MHRYDDPCIPLARAGDSAFRVPEQPDSTDQLQRAISPRRLRLEVLGFVAQIKSVSNAAPGAVQSVFDTPSSYRRFTE